MIELTHEPIDLAKVLADTGTSECGAQVLFVGTTRQWTVTKDGSLETDFLHYDAYQEMAASKLEALEATARERWPIKTVVIVHRLGRVETSEPSVAVAVSTPHRAEAFEAARWLIDELKHQVPIWKQEHYVQNGVTWIHPTSGNCNCEAKAPPQECGDNEVLELSAESDRQSQ